MAPTKANATYAVITLSRLIKGPAKIIGKSPCSHSLPASTLKIATGSGPKKSALLSIRDCPSAWKADSVVKES